MDLNNLEFSTKDELDSYKEIHKLAKINGRLDPTNPTGYHSVSLSCECYGRYKSRGDGVRQPKVSIKFNCPFIIHLCLNSEKTKLIVDKPDPNKKYKKKNRVSVFTHNEECIRFHDNKAEDNGENSGNGVPAVEATAVKTVPEKYAAKRTTDRSVPNECTAESSTKQSNLDEPAAADKSVSDMAINTVFGKNAVKHTAGKSGPQVYAADANRENLSLGMPAAKAIALNTVTEEYANEYTRENEGLHVSAASDKSVSNMDITTSDPDKEPPTQSTKSNKSNISASESIKQKSVLEVPPTFDKSFSACDEKICFKELQELFIEDPFENELHEQSVSNIDDVEEIEFEVSTTKTYGTDKHEDLLQSGFHQESVGKDDDVREIEFEKSTTKTYGQREHEDLLHSEFHQKSVSNADDIDEIEFEESTTKTRGRPKNTKKTKPSGAPLCPALSDFNKKDLKAKANLILHLLLNNFNTASNVKEGSFDIRLDDFKKLLETNFLDTFLDKAITDQVIQHLQKFWKTDGQEITSHLKKVIKNKKKKNIYTCRTCQKEADNDTAQCSSCLSWYHLETCVPKHEMPFPDDKRKSWYCDECIQISRLS